MFRPNRIGTPHIHTSDYVNSNADWTPNQALLNARANTPYNVINASPVGDFGRSAIMWEGTETLTAARKWHLVQQFTVTPPLSGDTVGVEVIGHFSGVLPGNVKIMPVFFRMTAAEAAVLAGANSPAYDIPTYFGGNHDPLAVPTQTAVTATPISCDYKTQFLIRNTDPDILAGTYAHGFGIFNAIGADVAVTDFAIMCSVRQLNDQQNVTYRDTLR